LFRIRTDEMHIHTWADFANAPKRPNALLHNVPVGQETFYEEAFSKANSVLRIIRERNQKPEAILVTTTEVLAETEVLHDYDFIDDPTRLAHPRFDGLSTGFDLWTVDEQVGYFRSRLDNGRDSFSLKDLAIIFIDFVKYDMYRSDNFASIVIPEFLHAENFYRCGVTIGDEPESLRPLWDVLMSDPDSGALFQSLFSLGMELSEYITAHRNYYFSRYLVNVDIWSVDSVFEAAFSTDFWLLYSTGRRRDFDDHGVHHECVFFNGCVTSDRMTETPYGVTR
jgi:hypothetical protein